ncbi:exodeoxyribonuclease-like [Palaemon carinicauda]|uniref:exodeoxyribonuclease-like n=1 Tax=Palaemon carinicauda TaxID=392227 RepID=UPI0035B6375A
MEQHPLKILTWNVNGIRNKHIEVQHFCLENDLDIICLQETKHTDANKYQIRGYQMYTVDSLMRQSPYRGMITYIKNSIPVSYRIDVTLGEDTNSQLFNIHDEKGNIKIKIMNVYITDNKLDFSGLYEIVDGHPCILVGDLNPG